MEAEVEVEENNLLNINRSLNRSIEQKHSADQKELKALMFRCPFLWQGRWRPISFAVFSLLWNKWWQLLIIVDVVCNSVVQLIVTHAPIYDIPLVTILMYYFCEILFFFDVMLHVIHYFWSGIRYNMRSYRTNLFILLFDVITLVPISMFKPSNTYCFAIGRWLIILRVYRLIQFYAVRINDTVHRNRKICYLFQHGVYIVLLLHAGTCIWLDLNRTSEAVRWGWSSLGYKAGSLRRMKVKFEDYVNCLYYVACRSYNIIFGDSFPTDDAQKWFTTITMLTGFIIMRYSFAGTLAWDLVVENRRRIRFVYKFHHMMAYLKFRGASPGLIQQAKEYKNQLWKMKDGVLSSDTLSQLPLPLQKELIFDINVSHFRRTVIFRDMGEAFLRSVSLLMKHEIYLTGQIIWNQSIVKSGMICIKRGIVEILSDEDDESPMIAFKEGTVFGEISLFYSIPAKVTVRAATYVELQVLERTDFLHATIYKSSKFDILRSKVERRLNAAKARQAAILKYDLRDLRLIRARYRPMKVLKNHLAGIEDEDPTFVDNSHLYYMDDNNHRHEKFTPEYLELYVLSENVTSIRKPKICIRSTFPWILEPDTSFVAMLEFMHFLCVVCVCFICPYYAVTMDLTNILVNSLTVALVFNLYIQLTTAVVTKSTRSETVLDIAEYKMGTYGFYFDILSLFPLSVFTTSLDANSEVISCQIAVMLPMFQVWHVWDYMSKWEGKFHNNIKLLCLMKFTIIVVIGCFWSGCCLYFIACPMGLCYKGHWLEKLMFWETRLLVMDESRHEKPFLTALSFGTAIFLGMGTNNISPTDDDIPVVITIFILGSYVSLFYIATMCSIFLLSTKRKLKFRGSMRELFYFLTINQVSNKIKSRVKKFFSVQWYYNNGMSSKELFQDMSLNIQQEVLALEMLDTLHFCPLFEERSRDFLQTVAAKAHTVVLPDNEVVQHAGDIGRDMFIIQKGHCNVLNESGKIVKTLEPGSPFGVIEMLFGLPKVYTIVTTTNCILVHLEFTVLVQCLSSFPDDAQIIDALLQDDELLEKASDFLVAKPMNCKVDTKMNRLAQEIRDSFFIVNGKVEFERYVDIYKRFGILQYSRYIIIPGCITPYGVFLKLWCLLRFVFAFYYIVITPYQIAVHHGAKRVNFDWCDIFLYVDVVVMCYVAYYDEKSLLITHPFYTIKHYLKTSFLWDLITVLPFEVFLSFLYDNVRNIYIFRLNKMLQISRIISVFNHLESNIMRVHHTVVLLKFFPVAFTIVNLVTPFIFIAFCNPFVDPNKSYIRANCTRDYVTLAKNYFIKDAYEIYISIFFWCFNVFCGNDCIESCVPRRSVMIETMLLGIIGYIYFGFMFGSVASTQSTTSHALLDHVEKIKDLENFLYQNNVDPNLTMKTIKYFQYVWKRTNGRNPQKICRNLNSALMEDTLVFMYEKTLREVPLFSNVERSFIRVITQHLKEMYFLRGETVVQCKDIQTNIYIIYRGKVDVTSNYNEMITCMGPGGMFGNFTGHPVACSEVTIFASRSLDLLVLPCQTFFNLVKFYPKILVPLQKAFEMSRNYILPITMAFNENEDSDQSEDYNSSDFSEYQSIRGNSATSEVGFGVGLNPRLSHSSISHVSKSSINLFTLRSAILNNLYRPGTYVYQAFGYFSGFMVTMNNILVLYNFVSLNDCYILFWLHSIFDVFFYFRLYFVIHQGYASKLGEIILDKSRCRQRYFKKKRKFWIHIMANIPLEPLCLLLPSNKFLLMHYFRLNRLLRLTYLVDFYKQTSNQLSNNLAYLQAAMTIFGAAVLMHAFACGWLLGLIMLSPICTIRSIKKHFTDNEFLRQQWDFTTSFYLLSSAVTSTGLDEYNLANFIYTGIQTAWLLIGKMFAAILVATAIQLAYTAKHALLIYERSAMELIDVLKNQGLSKYQLRKFWKYIKQLWNTERGRQLPALLSQIPYVRRCDLMSGMFGHHLANCYLFSSTSQLFLRQLAASLDYTIFYPGNYIVVAGDCDPRMYWVSSGTVCVVSVRTDLTETTHETLGPGDVFGMIQVLNRGVSHCFSYRANTQVSMLSLSMESLNYLLHFFPSAKRKVKEKADVLFAQM